MFEKVGTPRCPESFRETAHRADATPEEGHALRAVPTC
jgi:hypothetical protein